MLSSTVGAGEYCLRGSVLSSRPGPLQGAAPSSSRTSPKPECLRFWLCFRRAFPAKLGRVSPVSGYFSDRRWRGAATALSAVPGPASADPGCSEPVLVFGPCGGAEDVLPVLGSKTSGPAPALPIGSRPTGVRIASPGPMGLELCSGGERVLAAKQAARVPRFRFRVQRPPCCCHNIAPPSVCRSG